MKPLRALLVYATDPQHDTFSYQTAWPRAFMRNPRFACRALNLVTAPAGRAAALALARLRGIDVVILLHSVFSNAPFLAGWLLEAIAKLPQPKAYFIGNEYKSMPDKMRFCEALDVALLVSQSEAPAVLALYRKRLGRAVMGLPHAGLDPERFVPRTPRRERPIDIGYRGEVPQSYIGHDERQRFIAHFRAHSHRYGLTIDLSTRAEDRLGGDAWAAFLDRCKAQLGTEAGGDFFELTDVTRLKVIAYEQAHPHAEFGEIFERFFAGYPAPVPIRIISGRNIEAAGTKTLQLLMEGHYGGYLEPDVHYVPIKKDLSNCDEAVAKLADEAYCDSLVENAHAMALDRLTYDKLIQRFRAALRDVL